MELPRDLAACGFQQRQQALQEASWRLTEEDLTRRVSLLEALLRRRSGLEAPAAPPHGFTEAFEGPFVRRGAPEEQLYLPKEAPKAVMAAERPLSRLLAGDLSAMSQVLGL